MLGKKKDLKWYYNNEPVLVYVIFRYISAFIVKPLSKTRVTPNQITYLVFITGLIPAYLFSFGTFLYALAAVLILQLVSMFDCIDGMLAREKKQTSMYGVWIDHNFDKIVDFAIFFGISYGLYIQTYNPLVLIAGFVAISLRYLFELLRSYTLEAGLNEDSVGVKDKFTRIMYNGTSLANVYFALIFFVLFNQLFLFLILFDMYYILIYIGSFAYIRKSVKDK